MRIFVHKLNNYLMRNRIVKFNISERLGNFVHFEFTLGNGEVFSGLTYYFDYILNSGMFYNEDKIAVKHGSSLWYELFNCMVTYNLECLDEGKDLLGNRIEYA